MKKLQILITALPLFAIALQPILAATFGDFIYEYNGVSMTITDYRGGSNAVIPASINGKPVSAIGDNAFGSYEIDSVTIPSSVTSIGASAFSGCYSLRRVTFSSGLVSIGELAFSSSGITSLNLPSSLTTIGSNAFSYCEGLRSLTIPATVTSIGDSAFADCWSLVSVTIGSTALLDGTFIGCDMLASATFTGNAPPMLNQPFAGTDDDFRIYYYDGKKGFTWPSWQGYRTIPLGPEISVQQPSQTYLIDGKSKKSFGTVKRLKRKTKTFVIQNIGTGFLSDLTVSLSGTGKRSFLVSKPTKSSLGPGGTTTFNVTYKPNAVGAHNVKMLIRSNDSNENPFEINLSGRGVR